MHQIVTLVSLSFWGSSSTPLYVYIGVQDSAQVEKLLLVSECSSCFKQTQNWTLRCRPSSMFFRVGITAVSRTKHNGLAPPDHSQSADWALILEKTNKQTRNSQTDGFSHSIDLQEQPREIAIHYKSLTSTEPKLVPWTLKLKWQYSLCSYMDYFRKELSNHKQQDISHQWLSPNDSRWCHWKFCVSRFMFELCLNLYLHIYIYKSRYIEIQMILWFINTFPPGVSWIDFHPPRCPRCRFARGIPLLGGALCCCWSPRGDVAWTKVGFAVVDVHVLKQTLMGNEGKLQF